MVETFYTVSSCPVSVALVTDTHDWPAAPVLESLEKRQPELILIAGDFLYAAPPRVPGRLKMQESGNAAALLRDCASVAPTYVSIGNHDWMLNDLDLELISSLGVTLLDNRFVSVDINGQALCIGGLSSSKFTAYRHWRQSQQVSFLYPEPDRTVWAHRPEPETQWLDTFEQQPGFRILLCHHPEYVPRCLSNRAIDLIVSGHAHGGQWRYYSPIRRQWQGLYAPGQGLFPKLTGGIRGNHVISRGLSNNTLIPRLNNPPELVYIESNTLKQSNRISR
ncbi:MAG: metallophosphoesterase [Oscillospiraceae bacterium]|nr:metallophosphoesterase [Oscillospiraceae bacterium]